VLKYGGPMRQMIAARKEEPAPTTLLAAPAAPEPVVPLLLEIAGPPLPQPEAGALAERLTQMMDALQYRSGVPLPKLAVHFAAPEATPGWRLLTFESPVGSGDVLDPETLTLAVEALLRRHLATFLGVQEAVTLLNRIGETYPEVVKEAVRAVPAARIAEVLRRLAEEEVPLRNMRDVLEGITEAAAQEREPSRIADRTRIALKRYLLDAAATDGVLKALVITPELEQMIRDATRLIDGVERLALQPEVARELAETIDQTIASTGAAVLVTSFEARRAVRRLIEPALFDMPVLAFNELSPMTRLDVLGQIGLPAAMLPQDGPAPTAIAAE
jgi:type III secretion protein V